MKNYFSLLTLILLVSVVFSSCKDESSEVKPSSSAKPAFAQSASPIDIPLGLKNSSNSNATMVAGFINSANGIKDYLAYFNVPDNAVPFSKKSINGDPISYTWTTTGIEGTITVKWTYTETSKSKEWVVNATWTSQDRSGGYRLTAIENVGGTAGSMKIEILNNLVFLQLANYEYEYKVNGDRYLKADIALGGLSYVINVKADYSGDLLVNINGVKTYTALWNAAGAGSLTLWNVNGNLTYNWTI